MNQRVLVIEDELAVRALVERVLRKGGYTVLTAADGREGFKIAQLQKPDVLVLDLNLPDISGETVCQMIRSDAAIQGLPILVLTGRDTAGLPAACLDGGADDYLGKPFDTKEFTARVRALLRRPFGYQDNEAVIERGLMAIYPAERRISFGKHSMTGFTPKEFELLKHIVKNAPNVIDKNALALKAWGTPIDALNGRTLDVHVRRIRQKLGSAAHCLKTVPTIGYQWLPPTV